MSEPIQRVLSRNLSKALRSSNLDQARALLERLEAEAPLAKETRGHRLELLLPEGRLEPGP